MFSPPSGCILVKGVAPGQLEHSVPPAHNKATSEKRWMVPSRRGVARIAYLSQPCMPSRLGPTRTPRMRSRFLRSRTRCWTEREMCQTDTFGSRGPAPCHQSTSQPDISCRNLRPPARSAPPDMLCSRTGNARTQQQKRKCIGSRRKTPGVRRELARRSRPPLARWLPRDIPTTCTGSCSTCLLGTVCTPSPTCAGGLERMLRTCRPP